MWVLIEFSLSLRIGLENLAVIMFSDLSETYTVSHTRNKPKAEFKVVSLKAKKWSTEKIKITLSIPSEDYEEVFILEVWYEDDSFVLYGR